MTTRRFLLPLPLLVLALLFCGLARAEVRWEGDWPENEVVSLDLSDVPRKEAMRHLAQAAGWNYMAQDLGTDLVELHVEGQSARLVLEHLLSGGEFVARREDQLVAISRAERDILDSARRPSADEISNTQLERQAPKRRAPIEQGEDLFVSDEALIGPDDVVGDVFVWGGDVVISGTVTGTVAVFGGSAQLRDGAAVGGDVFGLRSSIDIENGARVDGEVAALFGSLERGDRVEVRCTTCGDQKKKGIESTLEQMAGTLAEVSLLWVIGAILLAVGLPRARLVRAELTKRPLRNLSVGALSLIVIVVLLLALVVTLIGIPLAALAAITAAFLCYLGVCLVMYAAGSLLLRGEDKNPYLQLALGCGAYFVLRLVPVAGSIGGLLVALLGVGALVTTRLGGLLGSDKHTAK